VERDDSKSVSNDSGLVAGCSSTHLTTLVRRGWPTQQMVDHRVQKMEFQLLHAVRERVFELGDRVHVLGVPVV